MDIITFRETDSVREAAEIFAIRAILKDKQIGDTVPPILNDKGQGVLQLQFFVNGVEVPFLPVLKSFLDMREEDINRRAADIIKDKATLGSLMDSISKCEKEIKEKIKQEFGITDEDF